MQLQVILHYLTTLTVFGVVLGYSNISNTNEEAALKSLDIVNAIKSQLYEKAENLLNSMPDESAIPGIIRDTYANNVGNIPLLLEFVNHIHDIKRSERILVNFWKQIQENKHLDPSSLLKLVRVMESKVIQQENFTTVQYPDVYNAYYEVIEALKNNTTDMFKTAIVSDTYNKDLNIKNIGDEIHTYNSSIWEDIINRTIDGLYQNTNMSKIMSAMWSHENPTQNMEALTCMYEKMKEQNDQNKQVVFKLIYRLYQIIKPDMYKNLSEELRTKIDLTIANLPTSIRNLFSLNRICIKNSKLDEYIKQTKDGFYVKIFTFVSTVKEVSSATEWSPELNVDRNEYRFKSLGYNSGYLVYAENVLPDIFGHSKKIYWNLELHGNEVYIYHQYSEKYLCAKKSYFGINAVVFEEKKSEECLWTFNSCVEKQILF